MNTVNALPAEAGAVPTPPAGYLLANRAYWNCRLTKFEIALMLIAAGLAVSLHLTPVLNSSIAIPLTIAFGALSYLSPVTGFFFIATTQFLPFPDGAKLNPAQIGVLVWLPVALLRYHRLTLGKLWLLWPVLPWLLWEAVVASQPVFAPSGDYVKALMYMVIACQLAGEARGEYLKCLLGLCLGSLLVMAAYWCFEAGLPVQINDWGGEREGFIRMGSVRADSVLVWPALLMGVSGLLGLQISLASLRDNRAAPAWLSPLSVILTMASLPPLISTMSHGAFAGFALVLTAFLWSLWLAHNSGAFSSARFRLFINTLLIASLLFTVLFFADVLQLRTKVLSMGQYYEDTSQDLGLAASRTEVWRDSVNTISKHPLLGLAGTDEKEVIPDQYADEGGYLSHNVFLDYGRYSGLPGMLLLIFFFFWPSFKMWQTGRYVRYLAFLLMHFSMLIFWMSLSFQYYKTFWALWMLMAVAISEPPPGFPLPANRLGPVAAENSLPTPPRPHPVPFAGTSSPRLIGRKRIPR